MQTISVLNKSIRNKQLNLLYHEKSEQSQGYIPEDIFRDPSKLLAALGFEDIVNEEPIKFIKTPGTIWEFYLLRLSSVSKRSYSKLIKPISAFEEPIEGSNRRQLGNPYAQWQQNYGRIVGNRELETAVKQFVTKLISRRCPIRQQKGSQDFIVKRQKAANAFFKYLLGRKISRNQLDELSSMDFDDKLTYLIKHFPSDKQYVSAGLMRCLYGGKNVNWVLGKLSKQVSLALDKNGLQNDNILSSELTQKLKNKSQKKQFKPPFKDIYDIGNRDRVNINFRVHTWLKLLNDTSNVAK